MPEFGCALLMPNTLSDLFFSPKRLFEKGPEVATGATGVLEENKLFEAGAAETGPPKSELPGWLGAAVVPPKRPVVGLLPNKFSPPEGLAPKRLLVGLASEDGLSFDDVGA